MAYYLFPFLLSGFCYMLNAKSRKQITIFLLVYMAALSGLRFETGYDWMAYSLNFDDLNFDNGLLAADTQNNFEPLYVALSIFIKLLGGSVQIVFLFASALVSYSLYSLIDKYDKKYIFLLPLYLGFCYLLSGFVVVRYSIAVSLCIISFACCRRNVYISIFLIILAALFHFFALIFIPFLFVEKLNLKLKKLKLFFLFLFLIILSFTFNLSSYLHLFSLLDGDSFFSKLSYYQNDARQSIPITVRLYLILNIFFIFSINQFYSELKKDYDLLNATLLVTYMLIISILFFYQIPSIWNRIMLFAIPLQAISLGYIDFKKLQMTVIFPLVFFVSLIVLIFTLLSEDTYYLPYESLVHKAFDLDTGVTRSKMELLFK